MGFWSLFTHHSGVNKDLITDGRWRTDSPLLSAVVEQLLKLSTMVNYEKLLIEGNTLVYAISLLF